MVLFNADRMLNALYKAYALLYIRTKQALIEAHLAPRIGKKGKDEPALVESLAQCSSPSRQKYLASDGSKQIWSISGQGIDTSSRQALQISQVVDGPGT